MTLMQEDTEMPGRRDAEGPPIWGTMAARTAPPTVSRKARLEESSRGLVFYIFTRRSSVPSGMV